jgi:hypothetical protein
MGPRTPDIPESPQSASRANEIGRDFAIASPRSNECPICHRSLAFFTRKRKCTLCHTVTCKDCSSKKTIPGEVACRNCIESRNLKRETTEESIKSPKDSPKVNSDEPLSSDASVMDLIPKGFFGYLRVRVLEARGLVAADTNLLGQKTSSDPYCIVSLSRDRTRRSTRVIQSTLNPVWNEIVEMPVRLPVQFVEIDVYDKDVTGSDDYIGKCYIPVERLPNGKPISGWFPLIFTKENEDPGTELVFGDAGTVPAGAIHLTVRLDYKIRSELRGYIRAAVSEQPPVKIKFDINALYGPLMLAIELLWTRMLSPFVNMFLYILLWENFVVSTVALLVWIPISRNVEYWPSVFFFFLDCVISYNFVRRSFRALSNPMEFTPESRIKKLNQRLAKVPGVVGQAAKLARAGTRAIADLRPGAESRAKTSPVAQITIPAEGVLPPDYEEQTLGSTIARLMSVSPSWLKEWLGSFQPLARTLADKISMLYDIFQGNHDLSLPVFMVCLVVGVILLYIPFRHFVSATGILLLFVMSPLMSFVSGAIAYLTRPRRYNDPSLFGLWNSFSSEWMSEDAVNVARKRHKVRGMSGLLP